MATPLVIFGCGYVGARLARAALSSGRPVRACGRNPARHEALREAGAELVTIDATKSKQFGPALHGLSSATVVYSIPPPPGMPAGEAVRRATQAALGAGARTFIYLGTTGMYGNQLDEDWIDEESAVAHDDPAMAPRHADEAAVQGAASAGLRTVVLRLAALYGPGRGVRVRLKKGDYKLIDDGNHWISRVHVDDVVRVILAAEDRAPPGATYLVGDDRPTRQREYALWLCERLGLPEPPSVPAFGAGVARSPQRGRRIRNDRMKRELGLSLLYPSYLEGEAQIEGEERGEPDRSGAATLPPPEPPPERPPFIRHLSQLPVDDNVRYGEGSEPLGDRAHLARAVGLSRLGVTLSRLAPGRRTSFPHAHSDEEELIYVLEGTPDVWIDGTLHRLRPGDVVGLPAGTGVAHTVINNSSDDALLLVASENRAEDRLVYPKNPERQSQLDEAQQWKDAPKHGGGGGHDGTPDASRRRE